MKILMKHFHLLCAVILIVPLITLAGCAASPTKRLALAEDGLATVNTAAIAAQATGLITPATYARLEPIALIATDSLLAAETAWKAGDTAGYSTKIKAAEALIAAFQATIADAEAPPAPATPKSVPNQSPSP